MTLKLPAIPAGKAQHFCWGVIAGGLGRQTGAFVGLDPRLSAFCASFAVGFIKELVDWQKGEGFSLPDLLVTTLGCVPSLQGA